MALRWAFRLTEDVSIHGANCPPGRVGRSHIRFSAAYVSLRSFGQTARLILSSPWSIIRGGGRASNPAHQVHSRRMTGRRVSGSAAPFKQDRARVARAETKSGVSKIKKNLRRSGAESDRATRLILCGVVVNIFTSEVVRRAVSWSASRRRGCPCVGRRFNPSCRSSWGGERSEYWGARRRPRW